MMARGVPANVPWAVLDTSVLLGGREPPPGTACATTPEAEAEVSPGGRDARRFAYWKEAGLQVRSATAAASTRVETAAQAAGSGARLSAADVSVLALAVDLGATLWTEDKTVLDVARRLGVPVHAHAGIEDLRTWRPRCRGCGRWFVEDPGGTCPVCGSPVVSRPSQDPPGRPRAPQRP